MPFGPFLPTYGFAQTTNGATRITQLFSTQAAVGFAPPSTAVAFLLQTDNANPDTVRFGIGVASNASLGHQLEPGRDSGFIPFGGSTLTISTITGGLTCAVHLTWFLNS